MVTIIGVRILFTSSIKIGLTLWGQMCKLSSIVEIYAMHFISEHHFSENDERNGLERYLAHCHIIRQLYSNLDRMYSMSRAGGDSRIM